MNCLRETCEKIRGCFGGWLGGPGAEADDYEIDPRNRLNSLSKASMELTSHYHRNSIVNKLPDSLNSSVVSSVYPSLSNVSEESTAHQEEQQQTD